MASETLLTARETGSMLGVSQRTVQRLATSGNLPPKYKLPGPNGQYLFDPADVAAYLAAREAEDEEDKKVATSP